MIRVNLSVIMAKKRKHSLKDVSAQTGISRTTLTSLYYEKGKGIHFDTIDKLCAYFDVGVEELIERVDKAS